MISGRDESKSYEEHKHDWSKQLGRCTWPSGVLGVPRMSGRSGEVLHAERTHMYVEWCMAQFVWWCLWSGPCKGIMEKMKVKWPIVLESTILQYKEQPRPTQRLQALLAHSNLLGTQNNNMHSYVGLWVWEGVAWLTTQLYWLAALLPKCRQWTCCGVAILTFIVNLQWHSCLEQRHSLADFDDSKWYCLCRGIHCNQAG